ncbi:two-partner secretion domain-containing protein [Caballeronia telluris]|uniref:Filamentous hemagglutinin-like protein n=1 Tax=Caballeronia telluris TaxID=326475 RepID=A0A158H2G7_9BURK|nr:filamentous hemagglutinin N-terminal domain-containing protein [Caballeronia telluris]SAL38515.1 filamentous hemagglutinin-like protein [Caballeronia telluris]
MQCRHHPATVQSRSTKPLFFQHHRTIRVAILALFLSATGASAFAAGPLPQGGQFVAGAGSIATRSNGVDITQSTPRAVIDWRGFSIGNGNTVNVNNGTGATLSRVTGTDRSLINGQLVATGSFYLINPQGVVVGPSGIVTTGGRFVASTLDIGNDNFMNGGPLSLAGSSDGVVVNLGKISSTGGDVFLISRKLVENDGSINAPTGSAELATGNQVLLRDSARGPQVFVQPGTRGDVVNKGSIEAAQIDLRAADGNVFALAGRNGDVRATGTETRDGKVWLVADRGTAHVHSGVEASDANGNGGTVITTGNTLHLDDAVIDAALWNVSTPEFNAGPLNSATLARNLSGGTSITVNATGANSASGNINFGAAVRWTGDASLTLNALHDVTLGPLATLANTGAGNLILRADSHGIDNGGSVVSRGTIDWSRGTGVVSALYDMNGTFTAGTVRSNPSWTAAPFSGLLSQFTAYRLISSRADMEKVSSDLSGVYALAKDIDFSTMGTQFNGVGGPGNAAFTGQFDGMGHAIRRVNLQAADDSQINLGLFATIGPTGVVRNLSVENAYANGSVSGPVGIIAGVNQGLITHSHTSGVSVQYFAGSGAGGFVARNDGTIERSSSSAGFTGLEALGGLAVVNNGLIVQSFVDGAASGGSRSNGGLLVTTNNGTIAQSYATGVASMTYLGGLVGTNDGTISESFAASPLDSHAYPQIKGGIALNNGGTIANNVFWDVQTSTATDGVYSGTPAPAANGLSTAQMSTASSFGPTWDFSPTGTWVMPAGGTHPVLRWQQAAQ